MTGNKLQIIKAIEDAPLDKLWELKEHRAIPEPKLILLGTVGEGGREDFYQPEPLS